MAPQMIAAILLAFLSLARGDCDLVEEQKAKDYISSMDAFLRSQWSESKKSQWNYYTNLTTANRKRMDEGLKVAFSLVIREAHKGANISVAKLCSNNTKAMFFRTLGISVALDQPATTIEITDRQNLVTGHMSEIFNRAKVCLDGTPANCLSLEPGIKEKMATSRDPDELLQLWEGWRDATGRQIRDNYTSLIEVSQELMNATNFRFADKGLYWLTSYDGSNPGRFRQSMDGMMQELMPLYRQLQVFVRNRLETVYPRSDLFQPKLIPAHLLGNILGAEWSNIHQHLLPFPNKGAVDITAELRRKNYSVMRMFQVSEEFFTSMGMMAMTDEFWNNSMLEKPTDGRQVDCHPTAYDFAVGKDYRIKMCTSVDRNNFFTILHEMGHIQHFMQYNHLPFFDHGSPNAGISEAIGDTLALSAGTTKHLKAIGLMDQDAVEDEQTDLNHLTNIALAKLPLIPYIYVADRYRRELWNGVATADNYTRHWWDLRCKYQGIVPPVERTEEDFDAGAIAQLSTNVPITRYFISTILEFQFYEALCNATNHSGPLFKCDFYNNIAAGTKLSEMLRLGTTKTWQETLEFFTGSAEIDVGPMLRYFRPLIDHLESINGDSLDWEDQCHAVLDSLIRPPPS